MGGGGSSGGGTSVTSQEIPAELKPLATKYTQYATTLADTPFQAYGAQRYANLNPTQQSGLAATMQRAQGGDPNVQAGSNYLQQVLAGGANPYLEEAINQSLGDVQSRVMSQFGGSNYGTTANQETLARSLGGVENDLRMGDYQQSRNRALQALPIALQYGQQGYTDASQMLSAGQIMQDQAQRGMDFNYEEFMRRQQDPYQKLAAMGGIFGSNLGGSSTTTSQQSGGGK